MNSQRSKCYVLEPLDKRWYPATITSLCTELRSYHIETEDGTVYRKTQSHLKTYQCSTEKRDTKKTRTIRSNNNSHNNNRPKHKVKPPNRLDL